MVSIRQLKQEEKAVQQQQQVLRELGAIVKDIERCERGILGLRGELEVINKQFQGPRTTRDDVAYLSGLLECAKKKLAWEKNLGSLQKRTPAVLQQMSALVNDKDYPPTEEVRNEMLAALQQVQAAMERLQGVKVE